MFLQIGKRPHSQSEGPLELLLACHARIRHFSALARRLGEAVSPEPSEVAESARVVERYFTVALPKHVEDEDLSLSPRLVTAKREDLAEALERMSREHREVDEIVLEVAPLWREVRDTPAHRTQNATALAAAGKRLEDLLLPHLALEEEKILPAIHAFACADRDKLAEEMRARRVGVQLVEPPRSA